MSTPAPFTPTAAAAAAKVVGLSKRFGATHALDEVSAALPSGMILGLVGPDGAGKTTLIRLLAGLMEPTSGSLEVLGRTPREGGDAGRDWLQRRSGWLRGPRSSTTSTCTRTCAPRPDTARAPAELLKFTDLAPSPRG